MRKKKNFSYRTKLIWFFSLAITITILVGLYNYVSSRMLMREMTDLINRTQELTEIYNQIDEVQVNFENYMFTRSSDSLELFYDSGNSVIKNNKILRKNAEFSERGIKIKNLTGMVDSYLEIADKIVVQKRNKQVDKYVTGYPEAVKEYAYIGEYIQEIMTEDLIDSAAKHTVIQEEIHRTTMINNIMLGLTIVLVSIMIVLFSFQITEPIIKLASYANDMSEGNYNIEVSQDTSSTEMMLLYQTFQMMTVSIREHLEQIHEKQKLEKSLIEEKYTNLRMKNALHEAELLALQSQVNPHFIFNTINIGAKIAMMQGDEVTCDYLENFAEIFRYNLKGLDYNATLKAELDNVVAYMSLLMTRFGDVINFKLDLPDDEEVKNYLLPRMTLQPLVENAYIHGISQHEEGGIIQVKVEKNEGIIIVKVTNTGGGISDEMIELILNRKLKKSKKEKKKGHTTGIGIDNVLKRLRLFYAKEDIMTIISDHNETSFILYLPLDKNGIDKEGPYE